MINFLHVGWDGNDLNNLIQHAISLIYDVINQALHSTAIYQQF